MFGARPSHFRSEKKKLKQEEHTMRVERWQAMPPELQQAELDMRFGINQGAKKQRKRIRKALDNPKITE